MAKHNSSPNCVGQTFGFISFKTQDGNKPSAAFRLQRSRILFSPADRVSLHIVCAVYFKPSQQTCSLKGTFSFLLTGDDAKKKKSLPQPMLCWVFNVIGKRRTKQPPGWECFIICGRGKFNQCGRMQSGQTLSPRGGEFRRRKKKKRFPERLLWIRQQLMCSSE